MRIFLDDFTQIGFHCVSVGGIEDSVQVLSHFVAHFLPGHVGTGVLLKIKLAPLPRNTAKDGDPSSLQSRVVLADDQLNTVQATCHQALQEGSLVDLMLAQGERNAKDLSFTIQVYPNGKQESGITNLACLPHFFVASIKENVREFT